MGAGYHLIHHTTYKHNYGHYFVYMDWAFGTLETPEEHERRKAERSAAEVAAKAAAAKQLVQGVVEVEAASSDGGSGDEAPLRRRARAVKA